MIDRDVKPGMRVMAFGLESGLPILCIVLRPYPSNCKQPKWVLQRPDGATIFHAAWQLQEVSQP